jgi:hypothetical protein
VVLLLLPASLAKADEPAWVADATVGPTLLLRSKSKAVGHLFKPHLAATVRRTVLPGLSVGGGVTAILDTSKHYRVLGGLAVARYAVVNGPVFSFGPSVGLGLGYDADILHDDLSASGKVLPYGFLAADARWNLGTRWQLGTELGWENLSMLRLGLLVGMRWGKELPR